MDLLENKDEDILLNTLKLTLALITQKKQETSQLGKVIGEEGDFKIIKRLMVLVKEGSSINFCNFTNKVYFYAISLLRAFLGYCPNTKKLIMLDKDEKDKNPRYPENICKTLLNMIKPINIGKIDSDVECAIISLLTEVIKEEPDNKRIIG